MAFDITPYVDMSPKKVRELIRKGVIDFPTAGMCRGYAQANMDAGISSMTASISIVMNEIRVLGMELKPPLIVHFPILSQSMS